MKNFTVNVDASSENPGKSVAAAILRCDGEIIDKETKSYENMTNNEAEYMGVILGIKLFLKHRENKDDKLVLISDSELVVKQINKEYTVRSSKMKRLNEQLAGFIEENKVNVEFIHRKREKNTEADKLARDELKRFQEVSNEKQLGNNKV